MKKAMILLVILLLLLLTACSGEAKEPVPDWPDRLTGEYDDALTFTYRGMEPTLAGADSLTGRMTALFSLEDGGTLALGWRRLAGAEVELLEDFLTETGGNTGVWTIDGSAPNTAESYVRLGRNWYALSAACGGLEDSDLLALVDGTVEVRAEKEAALPGAASSLWPEELPWNEDWTCLVLGDWELDPQAGKDALRPLLDSYKWLNTGPAAKTPGSGSQEIKITLADGAAGFRLEENGDLCWNGDLLRPIGNGGGESLLKNYAALQETGENMCAPPRLTLRCGEETAPALPEGTFSWNHTTRSGEHLENKDRSKGYWGNGYQSVSWLSLGQPILRANGEVTLEFASREPTKLRLSVFSELGEGTPVELQDGRFTPYAGVNTYLLVCTWDWIRYGGSGSGEYILLIEGAAELAPAGTETEEAVLTVTHADAYGCSYTLENRGERPFAFDGTYALLRRNAAGGWEWMQPLRWPMYGLSLKAEGGENQSQTFDWSHAYGTLPAGEYCIQLPGTLGSGIEKEVVYLRAGFILEEAVPEGSGPLTFCPLPEGITTGPYVLTGPRYRRTQILIAEEEGWKAAQDFSLFRKTEDGKLQYVPPAYRLPIWLNRPRSLSTGRDNTFEIDLAAQYGDLPMGTYVVRRVFIRLTEEERETMSAWPRETDEIPPERIVYGDQLLELTMPLGKVPRGVDPVDEWPNGYHGLDSTVLVSAQGSVFTSREARLQLTLNPADLWYDVEVESDYYYLYFEHKGEWFPVEHRRYSSHGLMAGLLQPGETRELVFPFTPHFGELPPGIYRMVISCTAPGQAAKDPQGSCIVIQFRILEDGTGTWDEVREAELLIRNYARELAARNPYRVPVELLSEFNRRYMQNRSDPGEFRISQDLYVSHWTVQRRQDRLLVTVWRDRDVERAEKLLSVYGFADVVRGEDPPPKPSRVTAENLGSRGRLEAIPLEQEFDLPDPVGIWLLRFTWTGEGSVSYDQGFYDFGGLPPYALEVYDASGGGWLELPQQQSTSATWLDWTSFEWIPGETAAECILTLSGFYGEFSPEKEYRVVFRSNIPGRGSCWTCPLPMENAA